MKVLYFGTYDARYPRNAQVISCLRRAGVEVVELNEPVWDERANWRAGARVAIRLAQAEAKLLLRPHADADAVIVGYPGHFDIPAAKRMGGPVVFNPLVSLHDTLVDDRRRFAHGSVAARALAAIDRLAVRSADVVVADTRAHGDYFATLGARRIEVCFVGAEERIFWRGWEAPERFTALFVGKLIPLHGLETILAAAARAPEVAFRVVGEGQLAHLLDSRPPNVEWVRWVEYERLGDEYRNAGCALGIFGTSAKAARVIPNKVFQALACGAPVVTADTPAARELLVGGESALLVPAGDAAALAEAVRELARDPRRIADGGHAAYRAAASEDVLGRRWRNVVERA